MPYHIGVGGVWKKCDNAHIGVGGVWKQIQKMYIGVGGVWKEFYTYLSASAGPYSASRIVTPSNATATVSILNDGTYGTTIVGGGTQTGNWLLGGTVAQVDVYLSGTGDTPTGAALNTWLNCATSRSWTLSVGTGVKSFTGTMQMRDASSLAVLDSQTCTIYAEATP
jgi:hypothetical protein